MATYIFDFDGTIADSFSLACNILVNHAEYLGCQPLTTTELLALKDMHAREVLKYLGVPFWRVALFVRKLRKITHEHVDEINIFAEWPSILNQLSVNHQIGLISSNSYKAVEFVLKKHHIFQVFDFISCDKSLFGKKRCLNKLLQQKNLNPSTTYYVGDEARDVEAAHAAKINSIAVSWGFNSNARLKQANPGQLISDFDQLKRMFDFRN